MNAIRLPTRTSPLFAKAYARVILVGVGVVAVAVAMMVLSHKELLRSIASIGGVGGCGDGSSQTKQQKLQQKSYHYVPSSVEEFVMNNLDLLGLNTTDYAETCTVIRDKSLPIHNDLQSYFRELDAYNQLLNEFEPITQDLRQLINANGDNIEEVCNVTKIHPNGLLDGVFKSRQVSMSTTEGYMEPLLPTFRSHKICENLRKYLMSMEYLVHDFYSMCMHMKRHSRTVFVDMGAALDFHGNENQPALYINKIYSKFGFKFDHIYAYEINEKAPSNVFEAVPEELQSSWHWINVGVDPEPGAKMNPFTTLANNFLPDDFVVVKLDIDTSPIENRLVRQLRDDPKLLQIVDVFYFEDHVLQKELSSAWGRSAEGSVGESLELMAKLREKGVASHYWP
jgi:hypothetical protein